MKDLSMGLDDLCKNVIGALIVFDLTDIKTYHSA
jgi:hypothetical protein